MVFVSTSESARPLPSAMISASTSASTSTSTSYSSLAAPPLHTSLSSTISSTTQLLQLLIPPLAQLGIAPKLPNLLLSSTSQPSPSPSPAPIADPQRFIKRQLALVQKVLIEKVWPDWEHALASELDGSTQQASTIFASWFVPDRPSEPLQGEIALSAYSVLSSLLSKRQSPPLRPRSIEIVVDLLDQLAQKVSLEQAYLIVFAAAEEDANDMMDERWERVLKELTSISTLVANKLGEANEGPPRRVGDNVPSSLEWSSYTSNLARSYSSLLHTLSSSPTLPRSLTSLSTTLSALYPSPAFMPTTLSATLPHLVPSTSFPVPVDSLLARHRLGELWRSTISELSDRDMARVLRLLLAEIHRKLLASRQSSGGRSTRIKAASWLLCEHFMPLKPNDSLWKIALEVVLDPSMSWIRQEETMAQVVFGWVGDDETSRVACLEMVMTAWTNAAGVKAAVLPNRIFLTSLLLLFISSLPPSHPSIVSISHSGFFVQAVSSHLSILQPTVRLLGMLVAEVVSAKAVPVGGELKPLTFGAEIWEGEGESKELCRRLRTIGEVNTEETKGWQEVLKQVFIDRSAESAVTLSQAPVRRTPPEAAPTLEPLTPATSKAPLISVIDSDDEDDLPRYPLPSAPAPSVLSALQSPDPSLYATAIPSSAAPATATRKRGRLRPPVYIPELTAYLKGQDPEGSKEEADAEAERVEMGLVEGELLVRRKAGWGHELDENAVDLTFALLGMQDQYEIEGFEDMKRKLMIALVSTCPTKVAPTIIEQYFTTSYSVAQRHTMLTALALGARELAGLSIEATADSLALAQASKPKLPPALHRRLLEAATPTPLDALTEDVTRVALSSVRNEAESTIPEASREKLVRVRRFASSTPSAHQRSSTAIFTTLASDSFIMPLVNRFWLYLRDVAHTSARSSGRGPYAGGAPAAILLEPIVLSQYLSTLALLLHAARSAHNFSDVLAPETTHLVLALRKSGSDHEDPQVVEKEMALILVILDSVVAVDGGKALMSRVEGGANLLGEVQSWAAEVFEAQERRGEVGKAGRTAAGVLLRIEEVMSRVRGRLGW